MSDRAGPHRARLDDVFEALGMAESPTCGDVVRVALGIDRRRVIVQTGFRVFGCGSAMARAADTLRVIKGMTVEEAKEQTELFAAEETRPENGNGGCAAVEQAVGAAIDDYTTQWPAISSP